MRCTLPALTLAAILALVSSVASEADPAEPWLLEGWIPGDGPRAVTTLPVDLDHPAEQPDGVGLDGSLLRAWPQSTRSIVGSPVFHDLDRDGTMDVIAGDDRYVYVWDFTGALRPGWPIQTGGTSQHAAIGDLDGDEVPEIAITSTFPTPKLWVFRLDGTTLPGWPVGTPYTQLANLTCPVIVDIDGDEEQEVGVAGENGVYLYERTGVPVAGWPYLWSVPVNNPQWSAPAVGDVDHDGDLEVAVGNACYPNWGVHLIRRDGTSMPGWPKVIKPVFASPALADLDEDGTLEIIVQEGDPGAQGSRLHVWRYDGSYLPGWPRTIAAEGFSSRSNPAVADLQNDGSLEIVTMTADGKLHIFRADGTELPGYPRQTAAHDPIASVAIADVNHDSVEEIFMTYWASSQQWVTGWDLAGNTWSGFPKLLYSPSDLNSHCSAHVADANGDGVFELTTAGASFSAGLVHVLTIDNSVADPASRMDWPKIRRDSVNRGCFCDASAAAVGEETAGRGGNAGVRVYPNPYTGRGELRIETPGAGRVVVVDIAGRVLLARTVPARASAIRWSDDGAAALRPGVYRVTWTPSAGGTPRGAASLLWLAP